MKKGMMMLSLLMQNCLEWSRKAGLRVIIDLHILRSHYFNAEEKPLWTKVEEQDKFIRLWKDLSKSLHEWPNSMVAYEFMNEPVADDAEQWNVLLARVADSIRKWEPHACSGYRIEPLAIGSYL